MIISSLFLINLVSAASIPIYVKPLSGDGSLNPNTAYIYTFNWTTDSSCNNVVFSNSSLTITTGNDGIGFINLTIPDSLSSIPSYICEYRNGELRKVHTLSSQFFDRVYVQSINATGNITADTGFFSYLGSLISRITKLFVTDIDASGNVDVGGDLNVTGTSYFTDTNFNGGWMDDGLSIINGDIYAQTGYFYNITSLNVTEQNLTVVDDLIVYGNTELKQNLTVDTNTLFVDSNTNMVGIGTSSPSQKLDVLGAIQLSDNTGSNEAGTIRWTGSDFQGYNGSSWNTFATSGGGSLWGQSGDDIYYNNGKVGIGITSPEDLLHINAANFTLKAGNAYDQLYIGGSGGTAALLYLDRNNEEGPAFRVDANDSVAALFVGGDGNVGIGTTSPEMNLHVWTGDAGTDPEWSIYDQFILEDNIASVMQFFTPNDRAGWLEFSDPDARNQGYLTYDHSGDYMAFGTNGSEQVRIDNSGNVGIGTTSPSRKLEVKEGNIVIQAGENTKALPIKGKADNSVDGTLGYINGSGTYLWMEKEDGTLTNLIRSYGDSYFTAGNVGIGTTSPKTKLMIRSDATAGAKPEFGLDNTADALRWGINYGQPVAGDVIFQSWAGAAGSESVRHNQLTLQYTTGNVGIGTTSPGALLHINTSTNLNRPIIEAISDGDETVGINFRTNGTSKGLIQWEARSGVEGVAIYSNGTALANRILFVNANGNVGIGTTSPSTTLNVWGNTTLGGTNTGHTSQDFTRLQGYGVLHADTNKYGNYGSLLFFANPTWTASAHQYLITNALDTNKFGIIRSVDATTIPTLTTAGAVGSGTADFVIDGDGNVGIGTTSPDNKLDVAGNISISTDAQKEFIFNTNAGTALGNIQSINEDGTHQALWFGTYNSGIQDGQMVITGAGNVGIGTTTPRSELDVRNGVVTAGTAGATAGTLQFAGYYTTDDILNTYGSGYSSAATTIGYAVKPKVGTANAFVSAAGNAAFSKGVLVIDNELEFLNAPAATIAVDSDVTMTSRFIVKSDGNVGINTTTPQNTLNVIGDLNVTGTSNLEGLTVNNNADSKFVGSVTPNLLFVDISTDRVGIGTSSPSYTLSVPNGEICEFTAGTSACSSDIRLKENIKPITNAIDMLMKLNPVEFTFKNTGESSAGLIAQDVEKVYPEWVVLKDDGYKTYDNPGFAFYLIKAVQEQQIQIEELRTELCKKDNTYTWCT